MMSKTNKTTKNKMGMEQTNVIPTFKNGQYEINYIGLTVLTVPIFVTAIGILCGVPLQFKTFLVGVLFYYFNGIIGITVGYHRLFSHRSYKACEGLQWFCAFAGAGAFEGSAKWWGRNHRIHHRYVDTDKDPYNATRGFVFSHLGWMIMKQNYAALGRVDVSDFYKNRVVMLQHRYFFRMAIVSGLLLPTVICGLGWNDWLGGYFYAAFAKMVILHHCTFFINSLAHAKCFGATQNYCDENTSQDSWVCALFTGGEGYHNYHHVFADDYRNGIKWYHFDPTKWFIRTCAALGLARNLYRTPNSVIELTKSRLIAKRAQKTLKEAEDIVAKYTLHSDAKLWKWDEIQDAVASGRKLMVIDNKVIDILKPIATGSGYTYKSTLINWYKAHPGGEHFLDLFIGKDATKAFHGGVYAHSTGANSYLEQLCVGYLDCDKKKENE